MTGTPFHMPAAPAVPVEDLAASSTKSWRVIGSSCLAPYHASSSRPFAQKITPLLLPPESAPGGSKMAENPNTPSEAASTPVAVLKPYFKNWRRLITLFVPKAASPSSKEGAGFRLYSLANQITSCILSNPFDVQV